MNSTILALRAITATAFQRLLLWITVGIGALLALFVGLTAYLGGWVNSWWYLLFVILAPLILVVATLVTALYLMAHRLLPRKLSSAERRTIRTFTGTLLGLAEIRSTPWPVMAFLIGKDVLRGKQSRFLESIVQNASGLKGGFDQIRGFFEHKSIEK